MSPAADTLLVSLGAWVGTFLLHATVLMAVALLGAKRVRSVWLRERLLRVALFGGLVTASVPALLDYEPLLGRIHLARADGPSIVRPARTEGAGAVPVREATPSLQLAWPASSTEPAQVLAAGTRTGPELLDRRPSRGAWGLLLLGAWILWTAHGYGRLARGWLRLRRRVEAREAMRGTLARDFAALKRRAGVWVPVRLTVSDEAPVPVALGLVRREICVPRRVLSSFTRTEIRAILAHELAHTKRRDAAWFLAYALFERAFPFLPLARRLHRELLATAELACDDLAVRWTGAHLELASSLTEIARWLVDAPVSPATVPSMARERSRLGTRVLRLLEPTALEARPERRATLLFASFATLGTVGALAPALGALTPTRPDADPDPTPVAEVAPAPASAGLPEPIVEPPTEASGGMPFGLQLDRELFTGEMGLLQDELGALREELGPLEDPGLDAAAVDLEHRMEELSLRSERVNRLLERMFEGAGPHDVGGAPRTDVPAESP